MTQLYRKRPVVVEVSEPFEGTIRSARDLHDWVRSHDGNVTGQAFWQADGSPDVWTLSLETTEGVMEVPAGWRIIRGIEGEFYPCSPTVFEKTYDLVGDESDDVDPLLVTGTDFRSRIARAVAAAQGVAAVTPHQEKITHAVIAALQGLYPAYVSDSMVAAFQKGWAAVDEATGGQGDPGMRTRAGLTMALATVAHEDVKVDWAGYTAARKLEDAQARLAGGSGTQVYRGRRATKDTISIPEAMAIMDEAIDEAEDLGYHQWQPSEASTSDLCAAMVLRGDGGDQCGRPNDSKWHTA